MRRLARALFVVALTALFTPAARAEWEFVRGDINDDAVIDIQDVFGVIDVTLLSGPTLCASAADIDDSGTLTIGDVIALLDHLFVSGVPLSAPFVECGGDPTPDGLRCFGPRLQCGQLKTPPPFGGVTMPEGILRENSALGDVDGDGVPDIVRAPFGESYIEVAFGRGDLTFEDAIPVPVGGSPRGIAVGDLDLDGHLDVVTVDSYALELRVLSGNGDGTFEPPVTYATPELIRFPRLRDLDHDGDLDFYGPGIGLINFPPVVGNAILLEGDGIGGFMPPIVAPLDSFAGNARFADVTGDGLEDLVIPDPIQGVRIYAGDTNLGFPTFVNAGSSVRVRSIALGDLDGDGDLDLADQQRDSDDFEIFVNDGMGNFTATQIFPESRPSFSLEWIDYDNDGDLDLSALLFTPLNRLAIYENVGTGSLAVGPQFVGFSAFSHRIADVDGNGHHDVILDTNNSVSGGAVLPNLASGLQGARLSRLSNWGWSVAAGDIDGDSIVDLIVGEIGSGNAPAARILLGVGDGTFSISPNILFAGSEVSQIELHDIDGDSDLDAVAILGSAPSSEIVVSLGDGTGSFAAPIPVTFGFGPRSFAVGDVNSDSILDIVAYGSTGGVRLGTGGASFATSTLPGFGLGSFAAGEIRLADMNGDGDLDLVTVNGNADNVWVGFGNGTGAFVTPSVLAGIGDDLDQLAVEDLDSDGDLDVAVTSAEARVRVLLNDGTGTLSEVGSYLVGVSLRDLQAADVDGDGVPDLIVTNEFRDSLVIRFGEGTGLFPTSLQFAAGEEPRGLVATDLDADGDVDLVVANRRGEGIAILLGFTIP